MQNGVVDSQINRTFSEADLEGGMGEVCPLFFCNHLFFCDDFEELQTVLIEVKLIINNAPLTYVYPNTIKTFNTQIVIMLFRQL